MDFLRTELKRAAASGLAVAATAALASCGGQPPFPGSARGLDELGSEALEAIERDDLGALEPLRLTEVEHNTVVWPELPAAAAGYSLDLAWRNIQLRNQRAVPRAASALRSVFRQAGKPRFQGAACEGETQSFDTFVVHTDCYVRFRAGNADYKIQLFKDVLERNGGYKVFRYYDEDVERTDEDERADP